MFKILIGVDDFTPDHLVRIRAAAAPWADVVTVPQSVPIGEYRSMMLDADVVVGWPQPDSLFSTSVRLLQIGSAGWDRYEGKGLESQGIIICSGRGIHSVGVAEHCVAMMFALARRLPDHVSDKNHRLFQRHPPYMELTGATACIVGLGDIGTELARRCKGIGMKVVGVVRDANRSYPAVDQVFAVGDLKAAIRIADHIFMTASGSASNSGFFSHEVLESINPGSYFYNISRGSTVDETALCELLLQGRIAGAGLDVTAVEPLPADSPLWGLGNNVLITGHSAGLSAHYPDRFCDLTIDNLERFYRREPLINRVM
jgi:phosphoglycerate dehydrogenase-like enzyme